MPLTDILIGVLVVAVVVGGGGFLLHRRARSKAEYAEALAELPPQEQDRHRQIVAARGELARARKDQERAVSAARKKVSAMSDPKPLARAGSAALTPVTFSVGGSSRDVTERTTAALVTADQVAGAVPSVARYNPCHLDGRRVGGPEDLARLCDQARARDEKVKFLVVSDPSWVEAVTVPERDQLDAMALTTKMPAVSRRVGAHRAGLERARQELAQVESDTRAVDEVTQRLAELGQDPMEKKDEDEERHEESR